MKLINSLFSVFIIFLFVSGCSGIDQKPGLVSSIQIIDFGQFKVEEVRRDQSENKGMGGVRISKNQKLLSSGVTFPIELGTNFGFRYKIIGIPSDGEKDITIKIIYPSKGIHNPKTGKTSNSYQSTKYMKFNRTYFHSYYFRHKWETVPGLWTFQVLVDGKIRAEKEFQLASVLTANQ